MSYVLTTPEMLAAAATDVGNIGGAISTASSNAAGPTIGLLPAAEDEVSAAIAKLFGAYGQEYQAVVAQAGAFHDEFTQALAAAGNRYLEVEAANSALMPVPSNALNTITSPIQTLFGQTAVTGGLSGVSAMTSMPWAASASPLIALIMSGTGNPILDPGYVTSIFNSHIQPTTLLAGAIPQGLFTPEQFWPITPSLGNLTFCQSVAQGVNVLNAALAGPTGVLMQENNALVLTQELPLLQPIRGIPFVGNPIADVLRPDRRLLLDLGYDPYGPGLNYANIPTPAGLLEVVKPFTTTPDLTIGAVQGPQAALVDPGVLPQSATPTIYPYVASIDPFLGRPSTTGLSVLSGATGDVLQLIPPVH